MKTMIGNGEIKNIPSKKRQNINSEAAFKAKDERGAKKEKFDRDCLSEDDLDRILACT